MAKIKIKKGDQVLVISGKDKGKKGEVLRVNKSANTLIVEGINISKKHIKNSPNVTQAGIVDTESPINISNVMFIRPENSNIGRITFEKLDSGKYNRIVKKSKRS
jgi:large subunit ribosomal protein L24